MYGVSASWSAGSHSTPRGLTELIHQQRYAAMELHSKTVLRIDHPR